MANVCLNCFGDRELKAYINSQDSTGKCDFCDSEDISIIDISELYDFFKELLDNFQSKPNGQTLKSKIQSNWNLFSSLDVNYKILNFIVNIIDTNILSADELVDFSDEILENVNYWDKLKNQLIWERRYLTDINYLTEELGWDGFFSNQIPLTKDTKLFRARLHHKSNENAYTSDEMFCPPQHISTAGRANPTGIPYLYLSDNEETILYEIRASYLDEISIGTFTLQDNLEQLIYVSDFTESPTIFHPSKVTDKIKSSLLKQKISLDLSKPMRRYDLELDYIPTQFICEFIKVYTGVQGIKFRSSLHTVGNNIVLFDQKIVECESIKQVKVKKVQISI
ncbi:RES domain-containing protein [Flavobacterium sp.]|uniref:RES domain-containing protein n=1 Tax=Flavobacterium sp. TaxID=239 RepID=UPI00391CD112